MRYAKLCLLLWASVACSPVSQLQLRDDYDRIDKHATYRLNVVSSATPSEPKVAKLYGDIARRYSNDHRDFIVRQVAVVGSDAAEARASCVGRTEGVLWLKTRFAVQGGAVKVRIAGRLMRCKGWVQIWGATVASTFDSVDDQLSQLTRRYVAEIGQVAKVHASPAFRALRALLDTLPKPKLVKDADIDEKIDL